MTSSAFTVDGVASSGSGTVTSIATTAPISGGPITTTGTISLANASVTPGSYSSANITVDAHGLIQSASNGSGSGTAFQIVNVQVFTSSGTYTPTLHMQYCTVQCLAGGGGGGGVAATSGSTIAIGDGGGSGEYAVGTFSAATIGVSQVVTIGAGGTAGSPAGGTGGTGGTSSLGGLITSLGGQGGDYGLAVSAFSGVGGLGGNGGVGGDYRAPGAPGIAAYGSASPLFTASGAGASSQLGGGGQAVPTNGNGNAGLGYGSAGSGACNIVSSGSTRPGGAGAPGIIIITEYIS